MPTFETFIKGIDFTNKAVTVRESEITFAIYY